MSEEKAYQKPQSAKLVRIRELDPKIEYPVRILGIVVDIVSGTALIQDIYDDVKEAKSIWVSFDGELEMEKKYLLVGNVSQETIDDEKRMLLNATASLDVDELDIDVYRKAIEMESSVISAVKS